MKQSIEKRISELDKAMLAREGGGCLVAWQCAADETKYRLILPGQEVTGELWELEELEAVQRAEYFIVVDYYKTPLPGEQVPDE